MKLKIRTMKKIFTPLLFCFAAIIALPAGVNGQCGTGYTAAEMNWDNLDFLPSNNIRYTSFYPTATATTFPYNQNFTIGTRTLNFVMAPNNGTSLVLNGENGINTAHAGTPVTAGDDVQFTSTVTTPTTITMIFDAEVTNVQFSLFDLDSNQRVSITATNAASVAQTITLTRAGAAGITIGGTATNPTASAPTTSYADNDNTGSINVVISGTVKQVVITLDNSGGDIWLSDIDACVTGTFPADYQKISRPFTGQPQYVLAVVNNNIYYINPANGNGYFLFNEPGHTRLNSMAYDPYERIVYYTYSLTGGSNPQNDKTLKKYDVDNKVISVVIPNVNTFGIPTYESGVESGAATFYNGSLYLGIEGYTGTSGGGSYAAGRKSTIWKINFDAAGNAVPPAAQVWGVTADNGVNAANIHDWSDFAITNGVLVDFDGSNDEDYYQTNMFTGVTTNYIPVGPTPRQVSIGWDEAIYNVDATIAPYNGTSGNGTARTISAPIGPVIPTGSSASWGDAAGPYRPFLDFGDAPATYDPDPLAPACHDTLTPNNVSGARTRLRLGPNEDVEWLKKGFTTVEDLYEDGLAFVPIFSPASGSYQAQVSLVNNTGFNATLCAWLDLNGNGLFDASEAITPINVTSAAGTRNFWLTWPSITSPLSTGMITHLRIRLTTASFGMNANNATGYYSTGEVEDYRVVVDNSPLSTQMISFDANTVSEAKVKLTWDATEEIGLEAYGIERSVNGSEWEQVAYQVVTRTGSTRHYELVDDNPYTGKSLYRLRLMEVNGHSKYSNIQTIEIRELPSVMRLFPNPVREAATLTITGGIAGQQAEVSILDGNGTVLSRQKIMLSAGVTAIRLPIDPAWPSGMYMTRINRDGKIEFKQFILRK